MKNKQQEEIEAKLQALYDQRKLVRLIEISMGGSTFVFQGKLKELADWLEKPDLSKLKIKKVTKNFYAPDEENLKNIFTNSVPYLVDISEDAVNIKMDSQFIFLSEEQAVEYNELQNQYQSIGDQNAKESPKV